MPKRIRRRTELVNSVRINLAEAERQCIAAMREQRQRDGPLGRKPRWRPWEFPD
jgi:hypothetical protein